MRTNNIAVTFAIALVVAVAVVFVYSRIDGSEPAEAVYQGRYPAWFTNLPENYSPAEMDFTYAAEKSVHGVVHVTTLIERNNNRGRSGDPFFDFFQFPGPDQREGMGSGVIITADGYIVTNYHVIREAAEISVTLNDGQSFAAFVTGADPNSDIAVLKINGNNLPFIEFGNSEDLRIGEWVLAVGNPMNLTSTVTAGIISAKARGLGVFHEQDMAIESFIQTDAPLNPGSSGGALVNLNGELVGVPTLILSPTGTYAGNSFAIPVSIVRKVVEDIIEFGEVQRAVLGVSILSVDAQIAEELGLERVTGIYVDDLMDGGAAQEAGIEEGDVIIEVDDRQVASVAQLQERISQYRPGDRVIIVVIREGQMLEITVTLNGLQ
jgi:serine protease Do